MARSLGTAMENQVVEAVRWCVANQAEVVFFRWNNTDWVKVSKGPIACEARSLEMAVLMLAPIVARVWKNPRGVKR